MRLTREAFFMLFEVHPPTWAPSMCVRGVRYEFILGEVSELCELGRLMSLEEVCQ